VYLQGTATLKPACLSPQLCHADRRRYGAIWRGPINVEASAGSGRGVDGSSDTLGLFKDDHVTYRPSGKAAPVPDPTEVTASHLTDVCSTTNSSFEAEQSIGQA
jgi:hypothetical protein